MTIFAAMSMVEVIGPGGIKTMPERSADSHAVRQMGYKRLDQILLAVPEMFPIPATNRRKRRRRRNEATNADQA